MPPTIPLFCGFKGEPNGNRNLRGPPQKRNSLLEAHPFKDMSGKPMWRQRVVGVFVTEDLGGELCLLHPGGGGPKEGRVRPIRRREMVAPLRVDP